MLKYCEAYRTMRESLCREQERGDLRSDGDHPRSCVGKGLSLPDHGFGSKVSKDCYVPKLEGVMKSASEDAEELEKPVRRQSVNFDEEFTFTPRLNLTSVRLAKERTGRAHEAVKRKMAALVAEAEMNFTFKPKVSSRSEKIAQGLKTSFLERQLIHMEKQRRKLDNQDVMQTSQLSHPRLSPVFHPSKHRKLLNGDLIKSEDSPEIEKNKLARSAHDCLMATEKDDTIEKNYVKSTTILHDKDKLFPAFKTKTGPESVKELVQNSPYNGLDENQASKQHRQAVAKHKRIKTHPPANNGKENVVGDIKEKVKQAEDHKRTSTLPGFAVKGIFHNIPIFDKIRQSKEIAENAIKENKVFVCHGPYPIVRASLRKRGWIEKHFKGCPAVAANNKNTSNLQERQTPGENGEEVNKLLNKALPSHKKEINQHRDSDGVDDQDDYCSKDSALWSAGYEGEDCEYSLLSRFCRNATASFFWTCKRDDIDFKYLKKDQIANHFSKAYSFTTKVGLCSHLRNLSWFENAQSDTFFPRCHRLSSDEEKQDFIDDFRITSACNILKLLITQSQNQPSATIPSIVKSNSTNSVRADPCSKLTYGLSSDNHSWPKSQRSKSSLAVGETSNLIGQVPLRAVTLALQACQEFIMGRQNEDIDEWREGTCLTDENWEDLIEYYYQIIHNGRTIECAQEFSGKCQKMLEEMRMFLPQLDLDGVRNVWIVKPGAKSRGRGIMCMDRLQDILKLVSSTVKKENRWIIQKYIECPLLIYNTKFDIRQWFLVTDWNPLTLWFYKDCYFRFCSQEFTLENFEPCIHLANNSIQKHYQNGIRDERLPEHNMWSSDDFRAYLRDRGKGSLWEEVINPGMRQAIVYTLECCQITLEARKNSFELYGADFMLGEDYKPWLIEINSSPAMSASTMVTRRLCANVIEDTMKVVLDRREDKNCDTGRFELAFKQAYIDAPPYIGIDLAVQGKAILRSCSPFRRQFSENRLVKLAKPKGLKATKEADDTEEESRQEDGNEGQDNLKKEKGAKSEGVVLKLKEKSLTLNCVETQSREEIIPDKNKAKKQSQKSRLWKSFEVLNIDRKKDEERNKELRTLNIKPGVKPVHKKETSETPKYPSSFRFRIVKKQKTARAGNMDNDENKVEPKVVTIPAVGVPRTILRYTDKRFRPGKTVAVDTGQEAR